MRELEFTVDHTDDEGRKYEGTFSIKASLSVREEAEVGRRRRSILGPSQVENVADQQDFLYAQYQAELAVRAVTSPSWWQKALGDDLAPSALAECGSQMTKALDKHRQERQSAAKFKEAELRAGADKGKQ